MIIGLTGGIGSGKSTVADFMSVHGKVKVIKADHLVAEILKNDRVKEVLTRWWGDWILNGKEIERAKVATIVFNHKDQLDRLERYLHPIVGLRIKNELKDEDEYDLVVLDAPLLFESGLDKICDTTVFVDTSYDKRKQWVQKNRNWSENDLIKRESAQMPLDAKRSKSEWVLENVGNLVDLQDNVINLLSRVRLPFGF